MSLRIRLILAFFLLAVVPLTAVTLYSYRSSADALRKAAEEEGRLTASEMSQRMEGVTAALSEQLDRLWDMPREPLQAAKENQADPRAAAALAGALGATASLLDRLEFVPGPVPPPDPRAPPGHPQPPVPPATGVPPGSPPAGKVRSPATPEPAGSERSAKADPTRRDLERIRAEVESARREALDAARLAAQQNHQTAQQEKARNHERIVVDVAGALQQATKALNDSHATAPPWVAVMTKGLAEGLQVGAAATAEGLRIGAREIEGRGHRKPSGDATWAAHRWMHGKLDVPIEREGKVVGSVNAELNKDRMLETVFSQARTDQGEVPFAVDDDGRLYTPQATQKATLTSLGVTEASGQPGATEVQHRDKWLVVKRRDPSGVTFGIARPLGDSLEALRRATFQNLMLGLLVIGIAAIGIIPISGRMTRDLTRLAETAGAIAHGDFRVRVPVRSDDEIGRLSSAFNRMAEGVEAHQKLVVEQERLQRELDLCRRIQSEMLPHGSLKLGFGEVKGVSIPAREVGGDFFNYFVLDDGKIGLLVGDVSGKGVGAALLMANVQATLRARLPLEQDLSALVDAIDRDVDERTPGGVYVTLFIAILDPRTRSLTYVNAGHHSQFVLRTTGVLERMPSAGLPVGLFAGHGYKATEIKLEAGDLIFFYTDGTIEMEDESGEMFSVDRLEMLLQTNHDGDIDTVLSRVEAALRNFRGKAEPFDDATMMALRLAAPVTRPGRAPESGEDASAHA